MSWIKVTIKDRAGHDSTEYRLMPDLPLEALEEELSFEYDSKNAFNEGYRGIDLRVIESPPKEWVESELKRVARRRDSLTNYFSYLKGILNES